MITTIKEFKNNINTTQDNVDENYADFKEVTSIIDPETLEPIDPEIYEIDTIVDIITDQEEIKKFEGASNIATTNLNYNTVGRNDILWLTVMLKPRNNSTAYPIGEMGVVQVKVLQTFYGLTKLKQLKSTDKVY